MSPGDARFETGAYPHRTGRPSSGSVGTAQEIQSPVLSGYLERKSTRPLTRVWRHRYFTLLDTHTQDKVLVESLTENSPPLKRYAITKKSDPELVGSSTKEEGRFLFTFRPNGGARIRLRCASKANAERWIQALKRAKLDTTSLSHPHPAVGESSVDVSPARGPAGVIKHLRPRPAPMTSMPPRSMTEGASVSQPVSPVRAYASSTVGYNADDSLRALRMSLPTEAAAESIKDAGAEDEVASVNSDSSVEPGSIDEAAAALELPHDDHYIDALAASHDELILPPQTPTSNGQSKDNHAIAGFVRRTLNPFHRRDTAGSTPPNSAAQGKGRSGKSHVAPNASAEAVVTTTWVEYDLVEVFENQRWILFRGWGSKFLPSDRALYTNRIGIKTNVGPQHSSDATPSDFSADAATSMQEDKDEQLRSDVVAFNRTSWEWCGPWRLEPLPSVMFSTSESRPKSGSFLESNNYSSSRRGLTATADSQQQQPQQPPKLVPSGSSSDASPSSLDALQPLSIMVASENAVHAEDAGGSMSNLVAPLPTEASSSNDWSLAFDFYEVENSIARGVPHVTRASSTAHVRCRRWVRERRRVITLTTPVSKPAIATSEDVSRATSSTAVVVLQGSLGTKGRAGSWYIRYYKLVRFYAEGADDELLGYALIAHESKERQVNAVNDLRITSGTAANKSPEAPVSEGDSSGSLWSEPPPPYLMQTSSLKTRFRPAEKPAAAGEAAAGVEEEGLQLPQYRPRYSSLSSSSLVQKIDLPRAGRFVVHGLASSTMNHSSVAVEKTFTADTRIEGEAWVDAINRAAQEIQKKGISLKEIIAAVPSSARRTRRLGSTHRRESRESLNPRVSRENSVVAEPGTVLTFEEEPASAGVGSTQLPLTQTIDSGVLASELARITGLMRERVVPIDLIDPKMDLVRFFRLFLADDAALTVKAFHESNGDVEVSLSNWSTATKDFPVDDIDLSPLPGSTPERRLTARTKTGAPIGPSVTRLDKRQRYHYFPDASPPTLLLKTTAKSLDVPYAESFSVVELWVVTRNENGVRVRLFMGPHFTKRPAFVASTIERACYAGSIATYEALRRRIVAVGESAYTAVKREVVTRDLARAVTTPSEITRPISPVEPSSATFASSLEAVAPVDVETSDASPLQAVLGDAARLLSERAADLVKLVGLLVLVWWMNEMLTQQRRTADAMLQLAQAIQERNRLTAPST